jgi:hypothetical protein
MTFRRGAAAILALVAVAAVTSVALPDRAAPPASTVAPGPAERAGAVLDAAVTAAGGGRPTVEMLRAAAAGAAIITGDEDTDGDGFDDDGRVQLNVDGSLQCLLVPAGDPHSFVGVADGMCVVGGAQVASSLPADDTTAPADTTP